MIAFLFFFWNVCLWDSLFVSRRLALFGTIQKKKNTRISQRVITLLIQRRSGEENYSFWTNGWALSLSTDLVTSFWTFPSIHMIFKKLCIFHAIKETKLANIKTESISKLSNFNFQWTITWSQNNFRHIFILFTLSRAINSMQCKLREVTQKKRFIWDPKKTNFKSFKFQEMKSYAWRFYLCFLHSCEIWNSFSDALKGNCVWCYCR